MVTLAAKTDAAGVSAFLLGMRQALQSATKPVASFALGDLAVEITASSDSLWVIARREGRGGLALRAAFLAVDFDCTSLKPKNR